MCAERVSVCGKIVDPAGAIKRGEEETAARWPFSRWALSAGHRAAEQYFLVTAQVLNARLDTPQPGASIQPVSADGHTSTGLSAALDERHGRGRQRDLSSYVFSNVDIDRPSTSGNPFHMQQVSLTQPGLARRLKRHLLKQPQQFFAICTPGLEEFAAKEVGALPNVTGVAGEAGGVTFAGPLDTIYHANLNLRTVNRVLLRVASFTARSYPELFGKVRRLDWELLTGFSASISLEVACRESRLHHTDNAAAAVYDGIVDHMRSLGVAVTRSEHAPVCVHVRMHNDECTLSMDSSGEILHKRGYREATAKAPLRETIAAALLAACEWQRYPAIADPMCGAGTCAIEAALMARGIAAGSARHFAFEHWPSFHAGKWERFRASAAPADRPPTLPRLVAADIEDGALRAARANAERAGVVEGIAFVKADCRDFNKDGTWGAQGLMICNPPYGRRIGTVDETRDLLRQFGARLRESCKGWHFGLLLAEPTHAKALGLPIARRLKFSNGGVPVEFVMGEVK